MLQFFVKSPTPRLRKSRTALQRVARRITWLVVPFVAIAILGIDVQPQTPSKTFTRNAKAIEDYDRTAIIRAGNSGNRAYMPYLRDVVTSTPMYRSPAETEAVIALVKLGDKERSRELECDLLTNDPATWQDLDYTMLRNIKGWFAIRAYYYMLNHEREYFQNLEQPQYHTDVLFGVIPPVVMAQLYFKRNVPQSIRPVAKSMYNPEGTRIAHRWKVWIEQHRVELERLPPLGRKGLSFSNDGCPAKP